jgi:DNA helicase-2/ATP-dependent DNA helicase PcrA
MMTEIRAVAVAGTPSEILEAVLDKTGYVRELEASRDPQD